MDLFRVLTWDPGARHSGQNGHPLFVWPQQGAGRIDDPAHEYLVLCLGSTAEGAVAEALGRFPRWTPAALDVPPGAPPGARKALVHYIGEPAVLDLDDPFVLADLGLRPSQVVARDRGATQQWGRRIHDLNTVDGVSWWSYYGPQWSSYGLWDWSSLTVAEPPVPLDLGQAVVRAAAGAISRPIELTPRRAS